MTDPRLFKLTKKDKDQYNKLIENIDPNLKHSILRKVGPKLLKILENEKINILQATLIKDINYLVEILENNPALEVKSVKRILFAFSYFFNENDEIPDIIPDFGYLDDATVVHWIVQIIKRDLENISKA
tara:strand:- start:1012 stop:1398 length:387 start_codon:yes stop_codon:yes gene_type:complete